MSADFIMKLISLNFGLVTALHCSSAEIRYHYIQIIQDINRLQICKIFANIWHGIFLCSSLTSNACHTFLEHFQMK
jgi:hypothetical protein